MSDEEIQFGDIEEVQYQVRRRPDLDGHFAVAPCGKLEAGDLPIFVDMDVLADMELHARENPNVELGGVMLGGQYIDDQGESFVMVRDSIRAEAYESSRGHFKFTQETWTRIGRRRDEFNDDLHMVGWYHTHPGWGIFLSSMDRFICENFFNRALDVAFVIDPKANERGWFFWNRSAADHLPRCSGFFVTASRFRNRDLTQYVTDIEGDRSMQAGSRRADDDIVQREIIHLWRPQLGWLGMALVAILAAQCGLMLILVVGVRSRPEPNQAAIDPAVVRAKVESETRQALFDELFAKVKIDEQGQVNVGQFAKDYASLRQQSEQLSRTEFLLSELTNSHRQLKDQLQAREASLEKLSIENKHLATRLATLEKSQPTSIAHRDPSVSSKSTDAADTANSSSGNLRQWLGIGLFAMLITGGLAGPWLLRRMNRPLPTHQDAALPPSTYVNPGNSPMPSKDKQGE